MEKNNIFYQFYRSVFSSLSEGHVVAGVPQTCFGIIPLVSKLRRNLKLKKLRR